MFWTVFLYAYFINALYCLARVLTVMQAFRRDRLNHGLNLIQFSEKSRFFNVCYRSLFFMCAKFYIMLTYYKIKLTLRGLNYVRNFT